MSTPQTESCNGLTVLYDGACPLCRREIGVYQGLKPLQPLRWHDVSLPQSALPNGGDRAAYLARFHVQQGDGKVLSGAAAFIALWLTLPGWRWLGRMGSLPGATPLLELVYHFFLLLRPAMQRVARALEPSDRPNDGVPPSLEVVSTSRLLSPPIAWRVLLLGCVLVAVFLAAAAGQPAPFIRADAELAHLLRGMAAIKAALSLGAISLLIWRFGRAIQPRTAIVYVLSASLMAAATMLVWQLTFIPLAAFCFHVGELAFLFVGWRDSRALSMLRRAK